MRQEEIDTQFSHTGALAGILLRVQGKDKYILRSLPAPGHGLPKLKGTTGEQSTSKETVLYFFIHTTFFSDIKKQKILFCAQKSKYLFLQSLHTED